MRLSLQPLRVRSRWRQLRALLAGCGLASSTKILFNRCLGSRSHADYWVQPLGVQRPLCIRPGTSDLDVFYQIFVDREYACLNDVRDPRLIVDCGANVGYSSAYFLSYFPKSTVVAIEPDAENFAALERNLDRYGDRIRKIRAGVWPTTAKLVMEQTPYRDGRAWTRQVRLARTGEPADIDGIDLGTVLASSGHDRISILKMDVEGAEAAIFAENYESWLPKVDVIAVELHDDSMFGKGTEVFHAAIAGQGFQVSQSGELTICRRPAAAIQAVSGEMTP